MGLGMAAIAGALTTLLIATGNIYQVQAALGALLTGELKYANDTVLSPHQELSKDHQQLGGISYGTNGRIRIIRGRFHLRSLTRERRRRSSRTTMPTN